MATGCINSKKISCFVPRSKPIKTKVPNNIFGALCKKSVKTIVFLRILHQHQSHYREAKSRSGRGRFRWKVFKIWANIGLVSNTKNIWANYEKLLRTFFHVFSCKKVWFSFRILQGCTKGQKSGGGPVVMRRAAAARRHLLICQNLGGPRPPWPPRLLHACVYLSLIRSTTVLWHIL